MLRPARGAGSRRFLYVRIATFFLGAGIWIGALIAERPEFTSLAIAVVAVGLLLGLFGRRGERD